MGELAWWIYPIESIAIGAAVFIGGHNLTCYYPFLLSHKFYITVKNPKLQKILVSDQFNRNKSSQTKHEDRNKMAVLGFIHYVIQFLLLSAIYTLDLYLIVSRVADIAFNMVFFQAIWLKLALVSLTACGISIISYHLDHGLGTLVNRHSR